MLTLISECADSNNSLTPPDAMLALASRNSRAKEHCNVRVWVGMRRRSGILGRSSVLEQRQQVIVGDQKIDQC
jgi:hypothetical protein